MAHRQEALGPTALGQPTGATGLGLPAHGPRAPLTSRTHERSARGRRLWEAGFAFPLPRGLLRCIFLSPLFFLMKSFPRLSECHVQGTESHQRGPRSPRPVGRLQSSRACAPAGEARPLPRLGIHGPSVCASSLLGRVSTAGRLGQAVAAQQAQAHPGTLGPPRLQTGLGAWHRVR